MCDFFFFYYYIQPFLTELINDNCTQTGGTVKSSETDDASASPGGILIDVYGMLTCYFVGKHGHIQSNNTLKKA